MTDNKLVFHYTLHQKLWNLLAENPGVSKERIAYENFTDDEKAKLGYYTCPACTYDIMVNREMTERDGGFSRCKYCPLKYNSEYSEECPENCLGDLFRQWQIMNDAYSVMKSLMDSVDIERNDMEKIRRLGKLASAFAAKIANLPVRKGVNYD